MNYHLAQINISRLIAPLDDPKIAEFVSQLEPINALADKALGFVWRLQSESGNAADIPITWYRRVKGEPSSVVLSRTPSGRYHVSSKLCCIFRDRAKWFEKAVKPGYCLWWIPSGHIPAVSEGRERQEHYQKHGATPHSFWFSQPFPQHTDEGVCV